MITKITDCTLELDDQRGRILVVKEGRVVVRIKRVPISWLSLPMIDLVSNNELLNTKVIRNK